MMGLSIIKMATIGILPSFVKKLYYRVKGARIGKKVKIGLFSYVNANSIEIGDYSTIGSFCFINVDCLKLGKRVKIHSFVAIDTGKVEIDDDSVIMEQVVIGGMLTPRSKLTIGKRVKVFPYSFINPTEKILIEDDVGIGGANYIFTHGSWQSILDGFPVSFGPVTIKRGVWFPWRVFVMPNVTVGEFATIGAGAIITKDIPPRSLAVGSPAKVIKSGSEYIKEYSPEEKDKIVRDILYEFSDYLNYLGYQANLQDNEKQILINYIRKKEKGKISYKPIFEKLPDSDIVISLFPLKESLVQQFAKENKMWFDIGKRRCSYQVAPMWEEIRNYFSRYGIRFEVIDEV